ncbi:GDSL-type esterase/lipase family protein [Aridibaculum aurantiacum]|uniref:GDSL-type esterase/lipase family protein n=1 Tax=Aridibaculum aurantiacum TaxID=2810307 RepID=UPI001A969B5B|nr:GDSL-type esterase/lipase family protein [Aridibaculum aurantiacum]
MKKITFFLLLFMLTSSYQLLAQQRPFWNEIQNFKKQDSIQAPPSNAILFIGSSSFTMWRDVKDYFPGHTIINRGFGGSSLPHLITYFDDVVKPYNPKQVVIYCGENDLTVDTVQPHHVLQRFTQLFNMIKQTYPAVPVAFISIKPSPSRANLMQRMELSNQLIRLFLAKQANTHYINVYNDMLVNGKPDPKLFIGDNLHMNAKGYAIWQKQIEPLLKK